MLQNRDANAVERVQMALQLRKQRLSYEEIAQRCGYATRDSARKAILRELNRCIAPNVDEYRQQELDILDTLHQKVWSMVVDVQNPNATPNLWAVDRLLKISEARRQLLNLDVKPDEDLAAQSYVKRVILTHTTTSIEVQNGSSD